MRRPARKTFSKTSRPSLFSRFKINREIKNKEKQQYKANIRKVENQKATKKYNSLKNNFNKISNIKNSYERKKKFDDLYDKIDIQVKKNKYDYRVDRDTYNKLLNLREKSFNGMENFKEN